MMNKNETIGTKIDKNVEKLQETKIKVENKFCEVIEEFKAKQENMGTKITNKLPSQTPVDVIEDSKFFIIKVNLPGIMKKDILLEVSNLKVFIKAEFNEIISEDAIYLKQERQVGNYYKEIRLPQEVIYEEANASFKNGVLTIKLPKLESKKHKIEIN